MRKIFIGLILFVSVFTGFAQQKTEFPKVDFSYAFGTPHRITVGRPTNGNRTILDLEPSNLSIIWWYKDLTDLPLNTPTEPQYNSYKRIADFIPDIDGKPFSTSRWTRLEGWLPALDNNYSDARGSIRIEMIGSESATIGKVEVVNTDTVPHRFQLTGKMDWSVNLGWVDPERWDADCLFCGYQDQRDRILIMGIGADRWTTAPDGKAMGDNLLTFIWDLKPGEKKTGWIIQPYRSYEVDLPTLRRKDWSQEMKVAKQEWFNLIGRAKSISIPDKDVETAFKACFADLYIMREPLAEGYIGSICGTQLYRNTGTIECIAATLALNQFGLHSDAAEQFQISLVTQGEDGNWADPHGWQAYMWSLPGFKSWVAMEHYRLTGDREYLERAYPHMLASSRFQEGQRARTRRMDGIQRPLNYGLMPRGMGDCGLFDVSDGWGVFIPHNIWSVYADSVTLEAARILGKTGDINELEKIFRTAKNDLLYTIDKGAIQEDGYRWIPGVAGKTIGSRWGVLNAVFPCHLLQPDHELIKGTLRYMEQNSSKGGVPLHTGGLVNGSWVAMTLDQMAETYLVRGDGDKAARCLYATLNHSSPLFTWVEERGQESGSREFSGDKQHLYGPLAVVRIIRDMLLMEDGNGLNLAPGTDRSWLASGKPVGVTDMPSHFGNITYQMQYDPKKGTVSGEIKMVPKPNQETCQWTTVHIRLPEGMKVASINSVTGASKAKILANGEGIRWEGPIGEVKFKVKVGK